MRVLFNIPVLIVASACVGAGFAWWTRRSNDSAGKQVEQMLRAFRVRVDLPTQVALERQFSRRSRWGTVGAGVCAAAAFVPSLLLHDGYAMLISLTTAAWLGEALGGALSTLTTGAEPPQEIRIASLQPHDIRDYLTRGETATQIVLGGLGILAVVAGAVLADSRDDQTSLGYLMIVLGAVSTTVVALSLFLERHILSTPVKAAHRRDLIAHDVLVATALRELLAATVLPALGAGYVVLRWLDEPLWTLAVWAALVLGAVYFLQQVRRRRSTTRIARHLTEGGLA